MLQLKTVVSWCLYLSDNKSVVLSKSNIAGSGNNGFFFFVSGELYWSNQPNPDESKIKLSLTIMSCSQTTEAVRSTGGISPCKGPTQHEQRLQLPKACFPGHLPSQLGRGTTGLPYWVVCGSSGSMRGWRALDSNVFTGSGFPWPGCWFWTLGPDLDLTSCFWFGWWKWVHKETQLPLTEQLLNFHIFKKELAELLTQNFNKDLGRVGEEAAFLGMRALSETHATNKVLKLSMEATQEIIPSLEADLTSSQNLKQSRGREAGGKGESSLMTKWQSLLITLKSKVVLQEMKAEPRQNKHNRTYLGKTRLEIGITKTL